MIASDVQKLNNLARSLKEKGLCKTTSEAFEKAKELMHLDSSLNVVPQSTQHKADLDKIHAEIAQLKEDINALHEELEQKKAEIEQLKKEKDELQAMKYR